MTDRKDERLVELESRLMFQEQALQDYGDIVTAQAREIDELRKALRLLETRLEQAINELPGSDEANVRPPHY